LNACLLHVAVHHIELSVLLALKWARWHRAGFSTADVHCCVREKKDDWYYFPSVFILLRVFVVVGVRFF
jgi:hypothetical protein